MHPGQSSLSEILWNPEARAYDIPGPTYAPETNLGFDPDARAPKTDRFSLGLDRSFGSDFTVGVTYVRKNQQDLRGWIVENATYEAMPYTFSNGQMGQFYPIASKPDERFFQLGNVTC